MKILRKTPFSVAFLFLSLEYATTWFLIFPDEIQKPFIYRQLVPTLTSLIPLPQAWAFILVQILFCIGLGLLMLHTYEKVWVKSFRNDVLLLASFYLVIFALNFSSPWKKGYDVPTAFFFLLLFILWGEKKYALSIPVFILSCLNKETTVLLIPVFMILNKNIKLSLVYLVSFVLVRAMTIYAFSDYEGVSMWIRPIENVVIYALQWKKTLVLFAGFLFVEYSALQNGGNIPFRAIVFIAVLFPILIILHLVSGYPFELRVFAEVLPLLFMSAFLKEKKEKNETQTIQPLA